MEREKLNPTTIENINKTLLRTIGISYDEFELLDFEDQQRLIRQYHKKQSGKKDDTCIVMIGNGESALFVRVKKHDKVLIGSGENSCFIEAGLTVEEERKRVDDAIDSMLYNKPVALVKKIIRRIKK